MALLDRVAHHVAFIRAGAAQRVVTSACIRYDRQQRLAIRGHQLGAGSEVQVSLRANRVLSAIAVGIVMRVEKERIHRLISMQINDAKKLPLANFVNPRFTGGNIFGISGQSRIQFAFRHQRKYLSVRVKPRPFSGREMRQGSSAPGGAARDKSSWTGLGLYCGFGSSGCWQVLRIASTFISARSST